MDVLVPPRVGHLICGLSNVSLGAVYFAHDIRVIHEVSSPDWYRD